MTLGALCWFRKPGLRSCFECLILWFIDWRMCSQSLPFVHLLHSKNNFLVTLDCLCGFEESIYPPPGHWLQIRTTLDKRQWHLFHSLSQSTRPKFTYVLTVVTKVERLSFMSTCRRLTLSLFKLLLSNGLHYLAMVYFVITWLQLHKALDSRRFFREFHRPCKGYPMNNVSIIELLVKLSRWNHGFCPKPWIYVNKHKVIEFS